MYDHLEEIETGSNPFDDILNEFEVAGASSISSDDDDLDFDFANMIVDPFENMNDEYAKIKSDLVLKQVNSFLASNGHF